MKHQLITFCICLFTISGFAQKGVQLFMETGAHTAYIKSSNLHFIDYEYVLWCFGDPMPDYFTPDVPTRLSTDFTLATSFNAGVIINQRWYLNSGLRYDVKKYSNEYVCRDCEQADFSYDYQTQSTAFEIPITIRYRIITDLAVSPYLMAESYLSFREIKNVMPNDAHYGIKENIDKTFTGYRVGVGVNYQLNPRIEFNLMGSWGQTMLLEEAFNDKQDDNFVYAATAKLTAYQLGFSIMHKF